MYTEFDFSFYDDSVDSSDGWESASHGSLNVPEGSEEGGIDGGDGDGYFW